MSESENESSEDRDYEPTAEHQSRNYFSLEYMKRVVEFLDDKDPSTGKRKHKWTAVKRRFRRVPNPQCIARFRKYLEVGGTHQQRFEMIDTYVYDKFEDAR